MPELDGPVAYISFFLSLYTWGAVCLLVLALYKIAQFYEKKSGQRSYYPAFLIAVVLFIITAFRYAPLSPAITGDVWGDIAQFLGGSILVIFGLLLLRLMTGGRA
jgi:uncharacterized membrane protein